MNKKLAYIGLGAVVLYLMLRPKKASASTLTSRADAAQKELEREVGPTPAQPPNAPTGDSFKDPGTGQTIAGPSEPISSSGKHTVARGESWSNIASRAYGDYRWWPFLWDSNRGGNRFVSPDTLAVGAVIDLPAAVPPGPRYKARIFERAAAHAEWWQTKSRLQKSGGRPRPMPAIVLELTDTRIG